MSLVRRRRFTHFASALRLPSTILLLAVAGILLFSPAEARADAYKIVAITSTLPNSPVAINSSGQVAGTTNNNRAFIYQNGKIQELGGLPSGPGAPSTYSSAYDLNDAGQVVGVSAGRAFIYENGVMRDLGVNPSGYSKAYSINNSGTVVGGVDGGSSTKNFVYRDGMVTGIETPKDWYFNEAMAVNNSGVIAGYYIDVNFGYDPQVFIYGDGQLVPVQPYAYRYVFPNAINNDGWITGKASFSLSDEQGGSEVLRAFLSTSQGEPFLDLGTLGGESSSGYGINDLGQVVGNATLPDAVRRSHAFLYQNGKMIDLNNLLPQNSGWTLTTAYDINNSGQIVGVGTYQGQINVFLMTPDASPQPVPEPTTKLLLGTGIVGLGRVIRRRRQGKEK